MFVWGFTILKKIENWFTNKGTREISLLNKNIVRLVGSKQGSCSKGLKLPILRQFWNHFWDHSGTIFQPFWEHFWTILGQFRDNFGTILGPFWDLDGLILTFKVSKWPCRSPLHNRIICKWANASLVAKNGTKRIIPLLSLKSSLVDKEASNQKVS